MNVATHPTLGELKAFALGKLAEADRLEIEGHVSTCDECVRQLSSNREEDSLVALARQAAEELSPSLMAAFDKLEAVSATQKAIILPDLPTELLDHPRYEVKKRLGAGGMGVVYHAQHRMMDRSVALKVMNPAIMDSPDAIERFRREVKAAAKLNHPNIVTAFDADQAGNLHFLVMEYLDGLSLDRWVGKKGPLPMEQAAYFVRLAALGLQHAHLQGMVHRDIKPQNLFVTRKAQVKILDFGLARLAYGEGMASDDKTPGAAKGGKPTAEATLAGFKPRVTPEGLDRMTMTSAMLGTPDFVAPEQARDARNVDIRADLYSLGCTFYYLLSGRVPFPIGTLQERLMRHCLEEPTPIEKLRPDLKPEIVAMVKKLMAKRPADRFQTPGELAAALLPYARLPSSLPVPEVAPVPLVAPSLSASQSLTDTSPVASGSRTLRESGRGRSNLRRKGVRPGRPEAVVPRWLVIFLTLAVGLIALLIGGKLLWNALAPRFLQASAASEADPLEPPDELAPPALRESPVLPAATASQSPHLASLPTPSRAADPKYAPVGQEAKVLFLLPRRGLWLPDFEPVRRRLESANCKCGVATLGQEASLALEGRGTVKADYNLATAPPNVAHHFDVIIFVGAETDDFTQGEGGRHTRRLLADAQAQGKLIAALCKGQQVLLAHGVLAGRQVARNPQITQEGGYPSDVKPLDLPAVVDGSIITGAHPDAAAAFADSLLAELRRRQR